MGSATGANFACLRIYKVAISRQGAFAESSYLVAVFAEEDDYRYAVAAANAEFLLHIGMNVSVEIANLHHGRGCFKVLKDWALPDAVAAPGSGKYQHRHFPPKSAKQLPLGMGQLNLFVYGPPPVLIRSGPILGNKIAQSLSLGVLVV